MNLSRREFMQMLAVASATGINLGTAQAETGTQKVASSVKSNMASADMYEVPKFGNVHILHMTDCHAQLRPVYFREPSVNLGIGTQKGHVPHLVGEKFLKNFGLKANTPEAHAFTYLNFTEAAAKYGKVGGFAHLATLVKKMKASRPGAILLDGGDTWQGTGLALWTNAQVMIDASRKMGVDVMTAHWECTYGEERMVQGIKELEAGGMDFVAQNITENEFNERVFKPYTLREMNGVKVAVIGQAFPYSPIANPAWMIPNWSYGIRDGEMQKMVDKARGEGAQAVIVLSHNGMDVDLKMASKVSGIDAIMGGHTHDAVPYPSLIKNAGGQTLVCNAGSNSKYLGVLDLDVKGNKVAGFQFRLLPVFSNFIEADKDMQDFLDKAHKQTVKFQGKEFVAEEKLSRVLAKNDAFLYRRGNFSGTWDQLICDGLIETQDCEISFSPGVRWGTSLVPGADITYEDMMTEVGLTYPQVTVNEFTGEKIKSILEDVCDNIFNPDPYYQQGGDMVRVGGLNYAVAPNGASGKRISQMTLNGKPIDPKKNYKVAGWASVAKPGEIPGDTGKVIWDVMEEYLTAKKHIEKVVVNDPKIIGMEGNPGYAKA
ncbi:MAG: thiosulfohydrolase SoxB [Halothiobacillaceae bacterium]|nr:MAG: thiosulfohydrolase SoxB [Halothiobacillaceae bacterium]